jgi:hypothetical protein
MTDIAKTPDGVAFLDNPHAPDFFADDAVGFFVNDGIFRVTFTSSRANHVTAPGPVARVVIGRLVMSEPAIERFATGVLDMIKRRRDAAKSAPDQPPPTMQ